MKLTPAQITKVENAVAEFIFDLDLSSGLRLDRVSVCAWLFPKTGNIVVRGNFPDWRNGAPGPTGLTSCDRRSNPATVAARLISDIQDS